MVSLAWMSERTSPFVGKDHWILDFIRFTVVQCDQHFYFVCELRPHEYVGKVWLFSYLIRSYSTWSRIASIYFPSVRDYNVIPNAHSRIITTIQKSKAKRTWNKKKRVAIHLRSCEKQKNGLTFLIKVLEDVELVCVRPRRSSKKNRNECVEKATVTSLYIQVDIELKEARRDEWCEQTKMSYFRRQMLCFFSLSNLLARKNSDRQMIHEQLIHFEYTEHVYFSISICFWPVAHAKFILFLFVYRFNSCLSIVLISISSKINSISR